MCLSTNRDERMTVPTNRNYLGIHHHPAGAWSCRLESLSRGGMVLVEGHEVHCAIV